MDVLLREMTWEERLATAKNTQTSPEVLALLARDPSLFLRLAALENPSLPVATMAEILRTIPPEIVWEIDGLAPTWLGTAEALLKNSALPGFLLLRFLGGNLPGPESWADVTNVNNTLCRLFISVIAHPNCPTSIVDAAVTSSLRTVRWAVATNGPLTEEQIEVLALEGEDERSFKSFGQALMENSNVSPDFLFSLVPRMSLESVSRIAKHFTGGQRGACLDLLLAPAGGRKYLGLAAWLTDDAVILDRLSFDEDERVRLEVAFNPNLGADAITRLCGDGDIHVRRRAGEHTTASDTDRVLVRLLDVF